MASTLLFIPRRITFAATIAAAAGGVNQVTYTVPAGLRAELYHIWLQMATNGATLGSGTLVAIAAGNIVLSCINQVAAGNTFSAGTLIDLAASETVIIQTTGGAVASITMRGTACIREYQ